MLSMMEMGDNTDDWSDDYVESSSKLNFTVKTSIYLITLSITKASFCSSVFAAGSYMLAALRSPTVGMSIDYTSFKVRWMYMCRPFYAYFDIFSPGSRHDGRNGSCYPR